MRHQAGDILKENLTLVRELGRGAMGAVWTAYNAALGAEVAVKLVEKVDNPVLCARFEQEARGLAQIDSPHVVRVFDYGISAKGHPFIVMELLRGEDLGARLRRVSRLDFATTHEIVRQCCLALGRAHALGTVHRDIKPANIFLCEAEGAIFVKVLDFGVAKFTTEANLSMTSSGVVMGTPYYMSPEQLVDPRTIDHRADLWSVGVVAYACLAGTVPFAGETLAGLSLAIHHGGFGKLTETRPDLPPGIDEWVARALAVPRERRFGSAAELAQAIGALAGPSTRAIVDSHAQTQAAAAPAPAASAPPGISGAPPLGVTGMPVATSLAAPARSGMSAVRWVLVAAVILLVGVGAYALGGRAGYSEGRSAAAKDKGSASGKKKKKKQESDETSESAPRATPPTTPTTDVPRDAVAPPPPPPAPSTTAPPPPKPKLPPRTKWRRTDKVCAKYDDARSCAACCSASEQIEPYPSCTCMFDGDEADRKHGRSPLP